ncbi:breast cancer anti-estrogen resistance protein 3 homolog [Parasteatoda tepidariorum]|nr:breast cancer anti-estrogen resistance protein 3 homolog [Parasteatoda tepidariorum]
MSENKLHLSIELWLQKLDLLRYKHLFKDYNGVEEILWMSERDLKNIGIKTGSHRARLSSSLAILKDKHDKMFRQNHGSPNFSGNNSPHTSISPIQHMSFSRHETGVRSWPSTNPSSSQSTTHCSPRSSLEGYPVTEHNATELKKALERELSLDSSDLKSHAWYHGTILRQRAEELVTQDGDFLVRDCISQPGDFVITCKWNDIPLHFIIKKIIVQPDTVYERIQFCFEKESFDSIPDFITYYVGSRCPLSESSGVIICRPVNRVMPLSYYASRYGVQCQIHYVAKALEKIPSTPTSISMNHNAMIIPDDKPSIIPVRPKNLITSFDDKKRTESIQTLPNKKNNQSSNKNSNLVRMGSDPSLNSQTEKRTVEPRPNSGVFNSDSVISVPMNSSDKPPPKPSRVPSKRCSQRPVIIKRERKLSQIDPIDTENSILIPSPSVAHLSYERQQSETRFSFLDRPSVSSCGSTPDVDSPQKEFTIPSMQPLSSFDPQTFRSHLIKAENAPLEGTVLSKIRNVLMSCSSKILACHLTKIDLEVIQNFEEIDLGLGVNSGLELFLLPQGERLIKDLNERTESIKLLIAVLILTSPEEEERVNLLNKWIEIAIETKTTLGNLYGFTSIMLGLTLPEILGLHSTWLALRHSFTEIAFAFETKLRPAFKALHNATGLEAPNTCFPYIFSLLLILQQYISVIKHISDEGLSESSSSTILNFYLPGSNSSEDFGLQLLADHLETGRNIMQQFPLFRMNGNMSLTNIGYDNTVLDIFRTEFHMRTLWGYRGSVVCHEDRHNIFRKVVYSLYQKCLAVNN